MWTLTFSEMRHCISDYYFLTYCRQAYMHMRMHTRSRKKIYMISANIPPDCNQHTQSLHKDSHVRTSIPSDCNQQTYCPSQVCFSHLPVQAITWSWQKHFKMRSYNPPIYTAEKWKTEDILLKAIISSLIIYCMNKTSHSDSCICTRTWMRCYNVHCVICKGSWET